MPSALSQLILDVGNMERSIRFYVDLLQLEMQDDASMDGVRLTTLAAGPARVLLVQRPSEGFAGGFDRSGGVVLNFEVRSLAHVMEGVRDRGVSVLRGLERSETGESSLLLADPDGYAVLVSQRSRHVH